MHRLGPCGLRSLGWILDQQPRGPPAGKVMGLLEAIPQGSSWVPDDPVCFHRRTNVVAQAMPQSWFPSHSSGCHKWITPKGSSRGSRSFIPTKGWSCLHLLILPQSCNHTWSAYLHTREGTVSMGECALMWSVAQADSDGVRTARVGERKGGKEDNTPRKVPLGL